MSRWCGLLLQACCACWLADWPSAGPLSRERGLPNPISLTSSHPASKRSPPARLTCSPEVESSKGGGIQGSSSRLERGARARITGANVGCLVWRHCSLLEGMSTRSSRRIASRRQDAMGDRDKDGAPAEVGV